MGGSQLYVVNSPDLVLSLQKQPKVVSFWYIEARFTAKLAGMSDQASEKLLENIHAKGNDRNLLIEGLKAVHQAMLPGEGLERMIRITGQSTTAAMEKFVMDEKARRIDLWDWVKHEITMMTTESVYGPANPYRNPEIERSFWYVLIPNDRNRSFLAGFLTHLRDFADDTVMLLTGLMPKVLASRAYRGRERVARAFEQYFANKDQEQGSDLVKARLRILQSDINSEDIARFESVNGIAILSNSVPTAFWTLFHVFSDPATLELVRQQVQGISTSGERDGKTFHTIDLSRIKELTVVASIIQESLRHRASGTGARLVMEDILLNDQYLLKKDSFLIIPNHELHFDQRTWGKKTDEFDALRFTKSNPQKIHSGAFRGFGGGVNLCPGKLFAMTEITALVSMLVLRFDMKPAASRWIEPGQDVTNMSLAIGPPREKVVVDIIPKKDSGGIWTFKT